VNCVNEEKVQDPPTDPFPAKLNMWYYHSISLSLDTCHFISLVIITKIQDLTLSGCTARHARLYAFLTSDGVTSWCISHLFHFASSHKTVCMEHKSARILFVLPSIQSRIWREKMIF